MNACQYPSDNHSKDHFKVWFGGDTPLALCGYHASWNLSTVLTEIRKATR